MVTTSLRPQTACRVARLLAVVFATRPAGLPVDSP